MGSTPDCLERGGIPGGCLYRTESAWYAAIASEWITAGGLNSQSDVENAFAENTDARLAAELMECWDDDGKPYDAELLVKAFARGRRGEWR